METVRHDGRETAYRLTRPDAGGPTALYVHGSGATHRVWAAQYGPAGPTHPAAALDLSGHGGSGDVDTEVGPATLRAYGADVVAVASAVGADLLVGNSLGGAVVQHVLLADRVDVSAAVLAGSGAKLAVTEALRTWLAGDFECAIDALHGDDMLFHEADERTERRSRETMRAVGRAVTERDFLTCHAFDVRDRVGELDVPLLALVGEHDRLTPPFYHEYYVEHAPDATVALIEDAAHLAMVERPAAFSEAVASFFGC
ncbi:MAG: alpha/beta hydrolase [Halobacteriales archaeon SW_9_67_25]|jgi:pimeloyl-ACP methyl ester carboxylesterase|nr:MAG: alpha/beta hydrolase [Halobacteriales archaeon SW_9_67_25]